MWRESSAETPPPCYDFDLAHYNSLEHLRPLMAP
jgi:hypothetical protein